MPQSNALFPDHSRVLIIAAHPDDETIGAGGLMQELLADSRRAIEGRPTDIAVSVVHLTDGSPTDPSAAREHGFATRETYAAARRAELHRAFAQLPKAPEHVWLGFSDQDLSFRLVQLVAQVASLLDAWQPSIVLTHPYEGGHPDHDSAALAVAAARRLAAHPPHHFEFTSYHLCESGMCAWKFLGIEENEVIRLSLDDETLGLKRQMLASFVSQQSTLQWLEPIPREELFRKAPAYDFGSPPHAPPLLYDRFPWGIDSATWLRQAAELLNIVAGREASWH